MQLMALNALLLFDAIFIFFLFLVSVSCLLYYLPLVPPNRSSSSRDLNTEEDADLESALVESGVDLDSETPHYCHHHYIRESEVGRGRSHRHHHLEDRDDDDETRAELELQLLHVSSSGGAHYHQVANHDVDHDHDQEVNDPCPTDEAATGRDHLHFNPGSPTHSNLNHQPQQDNPATHIIMTPPQRKYYQNSKKNKGQPFAQAETV